MKKIYMAAFVALMVIAPVAVFADEVAPIEGVARHGKQNRGRVVQLISIDASELSFADKDGETVTLSLSDDVRYMIADEDGPTVGSAADFNAGDWVAVQARYGDEDTRAVLGLVLLPEDFDPENRLERLMGQRAGGEVTAISSTSITVLNKAGESATFAIDADTEIKSEDNIEVGDYVGIITEEDGVAKVIFACLTDGLSRFGGPSGHGRPGGQGNHGNGNHFGPNNPKP